MKGNDNPSLFRYRRHLLDKIRVIRPDFFGNVLWRSQKYNDLADPITANPPGTSAGMPNLGTAQVEIPLLRMTHAVSRKSLITIWGQIEV